MRTSNAPVSLSRMHRDTSSWLLEEGIASSGGIALDRRFLQPGGTGKKTLGTGEASNPRGSRSSGRARGSASERRCNRKGVPPLAGRNALVTDVAPDLASARDYWGLGGVAVSICRSPMRLQRRGGPMHGSPSDVRWPRPARQARPNEDAAQALVAPVSTLGAVGPRAAATGVAVNARRCRTDAGAVAVRAMGSGRCLSARRSPVCFQWRYRVASRPAWCSIPSAPGTSTTNALAE